MNVLQQIVNGVSVGGVYSLVAIGWTTVWGIVGMINWTHGEVFMLGGFLGYILAGMHAPFPLQILLAGLGAGLLGMGLDRIAYAPLRKRKAPHIAILITALGASTFLKNLTSMLVGPEPRTYPNSATQSVVTLLQAGGQKVVMNSLQLYILVATAVVMLSLQFFITRTMVGKAMLATAQDREAVSLMGVRVEHLISVAFFLSGLLGGIAGVMIGTLYVVEPYMGVLAGIKGWAAAVLGGIGSISGAMLAGILLGIVENLTAAYISTGWRDAIGFLIMVLTLVVRPSGLMGLKADEKV